MHTLSRCWNAAPANPSTPNPVCPASAPAPPSGGQLGHPVLNLGPRLPAPFLPRVCGCGSPNCLACFCVRAHASLVPCPQGPAGPDPSRLWAPAIMSKPSLPGQRQRLWALTWSRSPVTAHCPQGHCPAPCGRLPVSLAAVTHCRTHGGKATQAQGPSVPGIRCPKWVFRAGGSRRESVFLAFSGSQRPSVCS